MTHMTQEAQEIKIKVVFGGSYPVATGKCTCKASLGDTEQHETPRVSDNRISETIKSVLKAIKDLKK